MSKAKVSAGWLASEWLDEPLLAFGEGGRHVSPRSGVARYGPGSYGLPRHPQVIRLGVVGPGRLIEAARDWLRGLADGVSGSETTPEFPGCDISRGYMARVEFADQWNQVLSQSEMTSVLGEAKRVRRFSAAVDLVDAKLRVIGEQDSPPAVVIVALPDDLVRQCGTWMSPTQGVTSFRDLRRSIKARAMRWRLPTQFLRESTIDGRDPTPVARVAWNLFTGLYTKAGGYPWSPVGLRPGTCYIGTLSAKLE